MNGAAAGIEFALSADIGRSIETEGDDAMWRGQRTPQVGIGIVGVDDGDAVGGKTGIDFTLGARHRLDAAKAGKVRRGGLAEVPMGMTINRLVHEIDGGNKEDS